MSGPAPQPHRFRVFSGETPDDQPVIDFGRIASRNVKKPWSGRKVRSSNLMIGGWHNPGALLALAGHSCGVIVIQRVRVRWGAHARGSVEAGLPDVFTLAAFEPADVVVHEVLLDEASSYQPILSVEYGKSAARSAGIWLKADSDAALTIDRLPGRQAYPIQRRRQRLFTLHNGQTGRYRANFRFTGCACAPQWYYEQWTTHIFNGASPSQEVFVNGQPHHDVDLRVHLYGGWHRASRKHPHPVR
jgi:hypothetical protein